MTNFELTIEKLKLESFKCSFILEILNFLSKSNSNDNDLKELIKHFSLQESLINITISGSKISNSVPKEAIDNLEEQHNISNEYIDSFESLDLDEVLTKALGTIKEKEVALYKEEPKNEVFVRNYGYYKLTDHDKHIREYLLSKVKEGDKIVFNDAKAEWVVQGRNENFIILTKPYYKKKTFFYTIIDINDWCRGPDANATMFTYNDKEEVKQALKALNLGQNHKDGIDVSYRNRVPLQVTSIKFKKKRSSND